jgi:glycosyltransferase involved in cell wall biosynthesis
MCNRCAIVIAPSQAIKDVLLGYGAKTRIEVLPTGLTRDPYMKSGARKSDFGVPEGSLLFSSAGRLGREKSFDVLFRALASINDKLPPWRLVIAGDGPERKNLEAMVVNLGIADNVKLLGYVSRDKVLDLLEASDLFTFASASETQGMVILEAMARRTPVVAADAMGPGQMMKGGRGGWLAKAGDADDFAAKILAAVGDKAALQAQADKARELAFEYAAEAINVKLAGIYAEAIRAGKS